MILSLLVVSAIISMVLPPMDGPSPTAPLSSTLAAVSPTVTVLAPLFSPYYAFIAFIVPIVIVTVTSIVVFRRTTPTKARTIQHLSSTPHCVGAYSLPPMIYGTACLLCGAVWLSSFTLIFDSVVRLCFGLTSLKDDAHPILYAFILLVATLGVFDDNLHFMNTRIALLNNEQQQNFVITESACIIAEPTLTDKRETITPRAAVPHELPVFPNSPVERSDAEPLPLHSAVASSHFSLGAAPPASPAYTSHALLDVTPLPPISRSPHVECAAHCHQDTAAQFVPDTQDEIMRDNPSNSTSSDAIEDTHAIVSVSVGAYTVNTTTAFQDETFSTLKSLCEELREQKQLNNELNKNVGCQSQQLKKTASLLMAVQSRCTRLENHLEARHDDIRSLDDKIYDLNQEIRSKDEDIYAKDDTISKQRRFLADSKKQIALLRKDKDKFLTIVTEQADLLREKQRTSVDAQIENGQLKSELATARQTLARERYEKLDAKVAAEEQLRVEIQAFQQRENGLKALLVDKNIDLEEVRADRDRVREELRKASERASVPIAPSTPPRRSVYQSTRTIPATTSSSAGFSRAPTSPVKPPTPPSSAPKVASAVLTPVSNHVGYRRPPLSPVKAPSRAKKAENASPLSRTLTRTETSLPRFDGTKPKK